MKRVQEGNPYCSVGTVLGKPKKAGSTSHSEFRSENNPTAMKQTIFLNLQQLTSNSNSANFNSNAKRITNLLKSITTTKPTFNGNSEKLELLEDIFQSSLTNHNQLTKEDEISFFLISHSWWSFADVQKNQQPLQKESGRNFDRFA